MKTMAEWLWEMEHAEEISRRTIKRLGAMAVCLDCSRYLACMPYGPDNAMLCAPCAHTEKRIEHVETRMDHELAVTISQIKARN